MLNAHTRWSELGSHELREVPDELGQPLVSFGLIRVDSMRRCLSGLGSGCGDPLGELRGGDDLDAMTAQCCEVPEVIRDHHGNVGHARNRGNVRVIDPPTDEAVVCCGAKEGSAVILRKLVHLESAQDLLLEEPPRVGRQDPQLFGESGRDRIKL